MEAPLPVVTHMRESRDHAGSWRPPRRGPPRPCAPLPQSPSERPAFPVPPRAPHRTIAASPADAHPPAPFRRDRFAKAG